MSLNPSALGAINLVKLETEIAQLEQAAMHKFGQLLQDIANKEKDEKNLRSDEKHLRKEADKDRQQAAKALAHGDVKEALKDLAKAQQAEDKIAQDQNKIAQDQKKIAQDEKQLGFPGIGDNQGKHHYHADPLLSAHLNLSNIV